MKRIIKMLVLILLVMVSFGFAVLQGNGSVVAIDETTILKKSLLHGLSDCYGNNNKYMVGSEIDGTTGEVTLDQLFTKKGKAVSEDTILVPSLQLGDKLTQDVPAVSCKQLFEGWAGPTGGSTKGLFELYGKSLDLSQMGYESSGEATKKRCLSVGFQYPVNNVMNTGNSNQVCFGVDENGMVLYNSKINSLVWDYGAAGTDQVVNGDLSVKTTSGGTGTGFMLQLDGSGGCGGGLGADQSNCMGKTDIPIQCSQITSTTSVSFQSIKDCLEKGLVGKEPTVNNDNTGKFIKLQNISIIDDGGTEGTISGLGSKWKMSTNKPARQALKYIAGADKFADVLFTPQEEYDILEYYVKKALDMYPDFAVDKDACYDSASDLGSDYGIFTGGKWCKVQGWEKVDGKFNVVKVGDYAGRQALKTVNFEGVLKRLKKVDMSQVSTTGVKVGGEEGEDDVCYENSGAIGWILCPIIKGVSNLGDYLWGQVETNFLQIQAGELFKKGGGLEETWGIFRNIANVAFIILFLIVIFSQLTGVGIDNYGIKKILPKLIVVAILINLSFVICALAVDVSNILGSGLNQLFGSMADTIPVNAVEVSVGQTLAVAGLASGGAVLFGLLAGPLAVISAGLSVLTIAFTLVVSMFFLFLVLMVRNAGVVILIAIAPVAIVCYMLPNTEKMFKKWVDLLKALLVVYPICGLMVGAGRLAGRLLASAGNDSGNEGMVIAGMVVEVLPFFLIPTLLRRSLSLMGNVGARLQNMGRTVSRGAVGKAKNTEGYKNLQQRRAEDSRFRSLRRRAGGYIGEDGQFHERGIRSRFAKSGLGKALGSDVAMGNARSEFVKLSVGRENAKVDMDDRVQNAQLTKAQNARNERLAEGVVGVLPIKQETMEEKMRAQQSNALEKMYTDNYSKKERPEVEKDFIAALQGDSGESAAAAMNVLLQKGGTDEALKAVSNNWSKIKDPGVKDYLAQSMGATNVDVFKSYSKYLQTGGAASFGDWASGNIGAAQRASETAAGVKDITYAQHLMENKEHALDNYTKDEMQFVENMANTGNLVTEMGSDKFGAMIGSAAINNRDAKAQTIIDRTIEKQVEKGNIAADNLGWTSSDLGSVRGETTESIIQGTMARTTATRSGAQRDLQSRLRLQITDAKANSDIRDRMKQKTKTNLGV